MNLNFKEDMPDELKNLIERLSDVKAIDNKTALINFEKELNPYQKTGYTARVAKQPATVDINKIGDRKEVGGIMYELAEKGCSGLLINAIVAIVLIIEIVAIVAIVRGR